MNNYLKRYIDNNIIREHATKDLKYYSCQLVDIPPEEQENLIDVIAQNDPAFRDAILDYVQKLIDERLLIVENEDRYNEGFIVREDPITGEQNWALNKLGGYS